MNRLILLVLLSMLMTSIYSQEIKYDEGQNVELITTQGSRIIGQLLSTTDEYVLIKTEYGESQVLKSEIKSLNYPETIVTEILDHEYSGSHYFFSPSAFNLKEGQSYYENIGIFLNSYTHGITDNISLTAGGEIASLLFGLGVPVLFFTPKVSLPFNNGAFSVSTTIVTVPEDDFNSAGFLQGALTIGDLKKNFTISAGLGYTFDDGFESAIVPITLSGMLPISEKLSLITENWFVTSNSDTEGIVSLGLRIHSRTKPNFLTVSLWRPTADIGNFVAYPALSGTIAIN